MYVINIQSISDIITNSSSETFCRISSQNDLLRIYEFLQEIFPRGDYEIDPIVDLRTIDGDWIEEDDIKDGDYANLSVAIEVPYHMNGMCNLLEHGLEPMLKDKFPNSDFKIDFEYD